MTIGELTEREETILWTARTYMVGDSGSIRIELHPVTSCPVITVRGKIMGNTAGMAIEKVGEFLEKIPGYILFDVHACDYMSSTMLGFIATLAIERHKENVDLFIIGVTEKMRWLLSVLDMDDFFQTRDSIDDATTETLACGAGSITETPLEN